MITSIKKLLLLFSFSQLTMAVSAQTMGESWKISYLESASAKYAEQMDSMPFFNVENSFILRLDKSGSTFRVLQSGKTVPMPAVSIEEEAPVYVCLIQDAGAPLDSVNMAADIIHAYFVRHSSVETPLFFYRKIVDAKNMSCHRVADVFENNLDFYSKEGPDAPVLKFEYKPEKLYGAVSSKSDSGLSAALQSGYGNTAFEAASFNGGALLCHKWLQENMRYPAKCKERGVQGVVVVSCIVEPDGRLGGVKAISSPHRSLGKEAVRLVKSMPRWNPAKVDGQEIRSAVTIPVLFENK